MTKTSDVFQLVHSDMSSILPMKSLGGCSYFMTFIDDFSSKTLLVFLKKKIKIFRTNNGTECESYEFNKFCRGAGIKRETSTIYAPEKILML